MAKRANQKRRLLQTRPSIALGAELFPTENCYKNPCEFNAFSRIKINELRSDCRKAEVLDCLYLTGTVRYREERPLNLVALHDRKLPILIAFYESLLHH